MARLVHERGVHAWKETRAARMKQLLAEARSLNPSHGFDATLFMHETTHVLCGIATMHLWMWRLHEALQNKREIAAEARVLQERLLVGT